MAAAIHSNSKSKSKINYSNSSAVNWSGLKFWAWTKAVAFGEGVVQQLPREYAAKAGHFPSTGNLIPSPKFERFGIGSSVPSRVAITQETIGHVGPDYGFWKNRTKRKYKWDFRGRKRLKADCTLPIINVLLSTICLYCRINSFRLVIYNIMYLYNMANRYNCTHSQRLLDNSLESSNFRTCCKL
mmetsp:Transcript_8096/g.12656  ORF Transcript_8096/g.12656 Transcript_8096/m.12656 type:complete len:185 (+) Transcript_8096:480-1034(+)